MALGAPPDLLRDTQNATLDEIAHAQLCFALASSYAGRDIGPGSMNITGALGDESDVDAIVLSVIVEACIGETLAACMASQAGKTAQDPVVADVLRTIAADELRHAALGWRFLRWCMQQADVVGRERTRRAFAAALAGVASTPMPAASPHPLDQHGRLSARTRAEITRDTLAQVLQPTARALFADVGWGHLNPSQVA